MNYALHNADCLEVMAILPAASIDAIISDPPYMTTNLHFDQGEGMDWQAWWDEAWRVVKPAGVVVLFAADLFTVDLILTQRANYRYRLVWEKTMPTGFLDANQRPLRCHEDVLVFAQRLNASTYNPQKQPGKAYAVNRSGQETPDHYGSGSRQNGAYTDRHPTTIIRFPNGEGRGKEGHPTQKPVDLMRWLVRTYTNAGNTVLDCFAGSGSTLEACLVEDRYSIGCELDAGYYAKAKARLDAVVCAPTLFSSPSLRD